MLPDSVTTMPNVANCSASESFCAVQVPIVAPKVSDVSSSNDEYRRINMLLLRNASIVNFFDGCALSIPCHAEGEAPVGLMLAGRRMGDPALLLLGLAVEQIVAPPPSSSRT